LRSSLFKGNFHDCHNRIIILFCNHLVITTLVYLPVLGVLPQHAPIM
jgi:hypothetical protein